MNVKNDANMLISYKTLRRILGILGMGLPLMLYLSTLMSGVYSLGPSISSYYFSNSGDLLVAVLCSFSVFLITYKGYSEADNIISSIAGFAAFLIAVFPAMNESSIKVNYLFSFLSPAAVTAVHFTSAAVFFLLLSIISFFLFVKTNQKAPLLKAKLNRNRIYRTCGIFIFVSLLLLAVCNLLPAYVFDKIARFRPIFWLETTALAAFGFSWLVKGETLSADKNPEYVFVYGTLRKYPGFDKNTILEGLSEYEGSASVCGRLYNVKVFPAMTESFNPEEKVRGDIYHIGTNPEVLGFLDEYEEITDNFPHPKEYLRKTITALSDSGRKYFCWIYIYNRDVSCLERIKSGDYIEYVKTKSLPE